MNTQLPKSLASSRRRSGSALIGVLWCVVLLSLVVVSVLYTARIDLLVARNYSDRIQARYLALAGTEKAKAMLLQDARDRSRSAKSYSAALQNAPAHFKDVRLGRGQYRVIREDPSGEPAYGVADEDGLLNINSASIEEFMKIRGMTPDVAAALVDWRDRDNTVSTSGAESEYYASLRPPYLARNDRFPSVREMLLVRGVTSTLLFGAGPGDSEAWSPLLTVHSEVANQSSSGVARVNVQNADESALTGVRGISPDIAKAIIAYRGQNRLENLVDLLEVTRGNSNNQGQNPRRGGRGGRGSQNVSDPNSSGGPKVIDERLFKDIVDSLTVSEDSELSGVVNVNSAPVEVLQCLPGMNRQLAIALIAQRSSNGYFDNIGQLLEVPGMSRDILKQISPRIAVRSETFRILAEGQVGERGTLARIETIVRVTLTDVKTLSWRENDL